MKKIISFVLIFCIFLQNFSVVYGVETNGSSSPWTMQKAEHLAKKTLFGATPKNVKNLFDAGSATQAVNLLFPSMQGPTRDTFNQEINTFTTQTGFSLTDTSWMRRYYAFKKYRDPYEAKAKLFVLFEDIFAVNADNSNIYFTDVENTHKLIEDNMFGSYKDLVKKVVYNGQDNGGDYSLGKFLDLFNQQYPNSPNENYARELMQLFLMLEYKPWENQDTDGAQKNYTDEDIASLARILTGLESDAVSHKVTFNPNKHNTGSFLFLTGALKSGDSFPFYNEASGSINSSIITTPILGNNGLTDNIIDYIFSKRGEEIANFLSWRLLKYYVKNNPTKDEISNFSNVIISNNFNIFDSVKNLLVSDIMYSDSSMNTVSYKNPLELTIGTLKLFHYKNPEIIDPFINDSSLLTSFEWTPYYPGSIFGRDGFDDNIKFFNAYNHNQFVNFSTKLAYYSNNVNYYNPLDFIVDTRVIQKASDLNLILNSNSGTTLSGVLKLQNVASTFSGDLYGGTGQTSDGPSFNADFFLPDFKIIDSFSGNLGTVSGVINISNSVLSSTGLNIPFFGKTQYALNFSGAIDPNSEVSRLITPQELITKLEDSLYLGKRLDPIIKDKFVTYLTTDSNGNIIQFLPEDVNYRNKYIRGVISMMLSQPEFLLNTGFDLSSSSNSSSSMLPSSNSKLVFVELYGGYDWVHAMIEKGDYDAYAQKRGSLAIPKENLIDLGDYYLNPTFSSFKQFFDSGNLKIFNRVGTPSHSRGHDTAAVQITSKQAKETMFSPSIIGNLIEGETDATKSIVLGTNSPNIYSNGNYLNIGSASSIYTNYASNLNSQEKTKQLDVLKDVLNTRNYPGNTSKLFKSSLVIDTVANTSKNSGGQPHSGYSLKQKFDFTKVLIDNNLGTTYYVPGGGGYDTHGDQVTTKTTDYDLDNRTTDLANSVSEFFNSVKNKDVTIVLYSEFGRTLKTNGTNGTDHGQGGGFFVLSSNSNLNSNLSNKVYGNQTLSKEKFDWLGVGIDYRSIYNTILNSLYTIPTSYLGEQYTLEKDLDLSKPKFINLQETVRNNGGGANFTVDLNIDSLNYDPTKASNVEIKYGKDFANLNTKLSQWSTFYAGNRVARGDRIKFDAYSSQTTFAYEIKVSNNQFVENTLTGIINLPTKNGTNTISGSGDTLLTNFNNKIVNGEETLGTKINLGNVTGTGVTEKILTKGNGISLKIGTGSTNIEKLSGSGVWNGRFILGNQIDKTLHLGTGSKLITNNKSLSELNIPKIIKIGADSNGVSLKLDREVEIEVDGLTPNKKYNIIFSHDGINWDLLTGSLSKPNGKINFRTNHFTFFGFVDDTDDTIDPINFSPLFDADLGKDYISNEVTISGINVGVNATISGGQMSVNSGSWIGSSILNNGDKIKLKLKSSGNYNTQLNSSISISGTNYNFSVTTKNQPIVPQPVSSSSGGGGSSLRMDSCPNGDKSPSYYDGKCDITVNKIILPENINKNSDIKHINNNLFNEDFFNSLVLLSNLDFDYNSKIKLNSIRYKINKVILDNSNGSIDIQIKQTKIIINYFESLKKNSRNIKVKNGLKYINTKLNINLNKIKSL